MIPALTSLTQQVDLTKDLKEGREEAVEASGEGRFAGQR